MDCCLEGMDKVAVQQMEKGLSRWEDKHWKAIAQKQEWGRDIDMAALPDDVRACVACVVVGVFDEFVLAEREAIEELWGRRN